MITLDGLTGITAPDFEPSSSTAPTNGMFLPTTNTLAWSTNSTERLRLDSSGNLGLGVTPSGWGNTFKSLELGTTGNFLTGYVGSSRIEIGANAYYNGTNWIYANTAAATRAIQISGEHRWYTAPSGTAGNAISFTQAMTLDASGNFIVGATGVRPSLGASLNQGNGTNQWELFVGNTSSANTSFGIEVYSNAVSAYRFQVGMGGTIYATSTSITAISDITLKENIRPLETGLAEVLALQPRRFDWKNGDGKNIAGFVAQEVETVLPDLVSDYKYNDEETKRGLKMGDMIPTLVKAIQELSAELNELKKRVG